MRILNPKDLARIYIRPRSDPCRGLRTSRCDPLSRVDYFGLADKPVYDPNPHFDNCNDETQRNKIKDQLRRICEKLKNCTECLNKVGNHKVDDYFKSKCDGNFEDITIHCLPAGAKYCEKPTVCGFGAADGFNLCPQAFEGTIDPVPPKPPKKGQPPEPPKCSIFCTIAHELTHLGGAEGNLSNTATQCFNKQCPAGKHQEPEIIKAQ